MILLTHADEERELYYGAEALAELRALDDVRLNSSGEPLAGAAFVAASSGCAIIIGDSKAVADAELFGGSPELIAYVHGHVDTRRIDVEAASASGVLVTHASAGFGPAVAELVIGFMIDLCRGITKSTLRWRAGGAPRTALSVQLCGKTLGIIGYGHIGRRLASIASCMGMRVLVNDPYVQLATDAGLEQTSLDRLLQVADFVVPLAVATPETANLIDENALARMRPSAFLINVARGELVDEAAVEQALDRGVIAGAAFDVGRAPYQMPSPRLASRGDVLATPHIGGVTLEANRHQALETVGQVAVLLAGEIPPGSLNPEHATRLRRDSGHWFGKVRSD